MISGSFAAIAFLALLYVGDVWFTIAISILAVIGFYEFIRLFQLRMGNSASIIGLLAMLWVLFPRIFNQLDISIAAWIWLVVFALLFTTVISKNRIHIQQAAVVFMGVFYIGIGFHAMTEVRAEGFVWALLIFICIWLTDTGAYLSGRWFGSRLLWPAISPKKTIEGAVGGAIVSIMTSVSFSQLYTSLELSLAKALLLGLLIAILAQAGDLIQSAYKRHAGVKDSGNLLPGHGGVLDRCDSWIIVFPFVLYFF